MSDKKYPKEFEDYWKSHRQSLIEAAPSVLRKERMNSGKMNTAGDWLLYIVPFIAGMGFFNCHIIKSELPNFIVSIVIAVLCFGLAMYISPYVTGKRSIVDIDDDIEAYFYTVYEKGGVDALERIRA